MTMIYAVSNQNGVIKHNIQVGGMTGDLFINFLQELSARLPGGRQYTLIFDNTHSYLTTPLLTEGLIKRDCLSM